MNAPSKRTMLALVTEAWGGRGGIAQYNRDLISSLNHIDTGLSIKVLPRLTDYTPDDVPEGLVQYAPCTGKFAYAAQAFRRALTTNPDIVFCGHLNMAPLGMLIAQAHGAALVIQLHGIESWQRPSVLKRHALERAALVLCVSRHTRSEILKYANIAPHRARVHANTYADDFVPGDRVGARKRFDIPDGAFAILSVGRLDSRERYKGHDRIIKNLPTIRANNPNVLYVVSGEGNDQARLESLANDANVADAVRFLGHVPRNVLPDLYRAADLFALPSTGEGFGIVFLEAMACGTPALGLGIAGALDALGDGELGMAPSPEELGSALIDATFTHKRDEETLAQAVKSRFGRERFTANAVAIFQRVSFP